MTARCARLLPRLLLLLPLALIACGDDSSTPRDLPDLQLLSMTFDPAIPTEGQTIAVTAVVKNIGAAEAPASMAGITVNGTQQEGCMDIPTSLLVVAQMDTVTCNMDPLAAGTYGVGLCVDVGSQADESDESNNCMLLYLVVVAGTD